MSVRICRSVVRNRTCVILLSRFKHLAACSQVMHDMHDAPLRDIHMHIAVWGKAMSCCPKSMP